MRRNLFLVAVTLAMVSHGAQVQVPVVEGKLDNGLRYLLVADSTVAVVSCRLYYFVGSMNEGPGTSGLSHMYEHMMFKGTKVLGTTSYKKELPYMQRIDSLDQLIQTHRLEKNPRSDSIITQLRAEIFEILNQQRQYIKKDELWELYQRAGGTGLNAWTADDMTAYIVTLPENKIELFFWIESDRMRNVVLREFYSERDVVLEERRMRYDNRPVNHYFERLNSVFYKAHPYRIPTIGWESDIRGYTREKMREHINKFYTPDNALIVLVGNMNIAETKKKIEQYFGNIPDAPQKIDPVVTREPEPIGQTRLIVKKQATPRLDILFHTPGYPHEDLWALDIIETTLNGKTGRLYRRLVLQEQLATQVGAGNAFRSQEGYFHIYAQLRPDADPGRVEQIIAEELEALKKHPPTDQELLRVKNNIRMQFISGLTSLEGLSDQLAWFERLNSWKDLQAYPEKIASVDIQTIPATVARLLDMEKATIGHLLTQSEVTQ